jgi:sorbitol-specific phosphotransferase system component IIBC
MRRLAIPAQYPYNNRMTKKKQDQKITVAVFKQMLTLATSGLGLVAALAWNNAIQEIVNTYIKPFIPNAGLISLLIYAILVTIIAVLVTVNLSKIIEKLET